MNTLKAKLLEIPENVSRDHFLLKIFMNGAQPEPGQFINIKTGTGTEPLLRRPFSIFDYHAGIASVIIRVVGKGTKLLSRLKPCDLDIIAPLGTRFRIVKNSRVLIAGGGVGNAPLYFLAKILKKNNNHITYIYGHRSKEYVFLPERYKSICDQLILVTDDGSEGEKGYTTDIAAMIKDKKSINFLYTCGPAVMMNKLFAYYNNDIPIDVSLENYFGCGIGLCSGCTIETSEGLKRACVDGPVFDGRKILWDNLLV